MSGDALSGQAAIVGIGIIAGLQNLTTGLNALFGSVVANLS